MYLHNIGELGGGTESIVTIVLIHSISAGQTIILLLNKTIKGMQHIFKSFKVFISTLKSDGTGSFNCSVIVIDQMKQIYLG